MFHVCEKCLEEELGLQEFIAVKGDSSKSCSYCHTKNNQKIELNQLTDHIFSCLKELYEIVKSKTPETIELLSFMEDRFPVKNKKLFQNIQQLISKKIGKKYLIKRRTLINSWDDFADYIKKESRFFSQKKQIF